MPIGLRLAVTGSGPGISDEDRERLFKPFFTAGKPGAPGLVYGSVSHWLNVMVEKITVDSAPARGTRFAVWLRFEPLPEQMSQSPLAA
ncbi:MAG: sensor histidine kinase [Betaproteobacteria bacterium]|nr:sensor histidine kinase [Candidatus Dechloromonas phosphorivorans]